MKASNIERGETCVGSEELAVTGGKRVAIVSSVVCLYVWDEESFFSLWQFQLRRGITEGIYLGWGEGEGKRSFSPEIPL